MPPTGNIWAIILVSSQNIKMLKAMGCNANNILQINSLSSFISDISWAFAMLLTTPLVVTVGLSLTIPLSLIGEILQYGRHSTFVYWIGAAVVFVSFLFVNNESREEESEKRDGVEERV
jgi:solute carrier family 35, member F5